MRAIRTSKTQGIYGAPRGHEDQIGGLPFYRERAGIGDVTAVYSVWTFSEGERRAIANGANLVVGLLGMEPIPPISMQLQNGPWVEEVVERTADATATPEEQGLTPGGEPADDWRKNVPGPPDPPRRQHPEPMG